MCGPVQQRSTAAKYSSRDDHRRPEQATLNKIEVFAAGEAFEITDEDARIQLSCCDGEVTTHSPYWYEGERAAQVAQKMFHLAQLVEQVTGLEGYDPQLDLPIAQAMGQVGDASAIFDNVARCFEDIGPT